MNVTQGTESQFGALVHFSARIGSNLLLVQGPGGNTSIKLADRLWVKASGTWLAEACERPIFLPLNLAGVRGRLAAGEVDPALPEVCQDAADLTLRPSIETTMHAVLPQRVVIHVHSVNTIAFAARVDGRDVLASRLQGLRWNWIPYARPGTALTRAIEAAVRGAPDVLVLANHGLVVAADTVDGAAQLLDEVERRLALAPRAAPPPDRPRLDRVADATGYRMFEGDEGHATATDPASLAMAMGGALYPDHVVFLGPSPLLVVAANEAATVMAQRRARGQEDPPLLLVRGAGVLVRSDLGRSAEEMARCLGLVLARIDPSWPLVFLTPAEERELLGWDAEKHRQALDRARVRH